MTARMRLPDIEEKDKPKRRPIPDHVPRMTTLFCLIMGFPTAYFIAARPERQRELWMLFVTIPFWTNLLIRTFAIMGLIRNDGLVNNLLMATGLTDAPVQMMFTDFAILLGMV